MSETRVYPFSCQSAQCGRIECPEDCPALPGLEAFKDWRDRTGAIVEDPVWCPSVYTTQRS